MRDDEIPTVGGSYTRDPKTGDLKRVEDPTTIEVQPPVEPTGIEPGLEPTGDPDGEAVPSTTRGKRT